MSDSNSQIDSFDDVDERAHIKKTKDSNTVWWVLGWIFIPFVTVFIWVGKTNKLKKWQKALIIISLVILYVLFGTYSRQSSPNAYQTAEDKIITEQDAALDTTDNNSDHEVSSSQERNPLGGFGLLLSGVGILFLFALAVVLIILPIEYELQFCAEWGDWPLCNGLALAQALCLLFLIIEFMSKEKDIDLVLIASVLFVVLTIIASIRASHKVRNLGGDSAACRTAALFQIILPISIVIILFIISRGIDAINKKKKK